MTKYKLILTPVVIFSIGILYWGALLLEIDLLDPLSNQDVKTSQEKSVASSEKFTKQVGGINQDERSHDTVLVNVGQYESIGETMERIKRDVVVTGTIVATPGQETAYFKIEGMPDRLFQINSQLMDGFIIKEITGDRVVLKNQNGDETFSLIIDGN